jgi:hypothetical protein
MRSAGGAWIRRVTMIPTWAACLMLAGIPGVANARNPAYSGDDAPKVILARYVPTSLIRVDGRLDEEVWQEATFHTDFRQKGRDTTFPPRAETAVAFVYDDEALYVGARMVADAEGRSRGLVAQRDDPGNSERLLVSLDTYRDLRTAFTFGVTIGGVRLDYLDARDDEGWRDDAFDPVWEARVAGDAESWTAEMRIPFSQLRFSPGSQEVWGVNVRRWNPATFLNVYWVAVPYEETGWVSRFGELRGLENLSPGRRIEVVPYALERRTYLDPALDPDARWRRSVRVGGDLKAGLGPNLTLEATANPDFGQVEADPARVNLTAFETFFPERRPFFLESRELFRTRGPDYFYSRRIGSVPRIEGARGVLEGVEEAKILAGGKLSGRLPGGLSLGVLSALTARESVRAGSEAGDLVEAAPPTIFLVSRLQQEVGDGGSSIGLMSTAVERSLSWDGGLRPLLPNRALAGGLDWVLRAGQGRYEVTGFLGGSRVTGSPEAVTRLQVSSAHYLQRPDASHVEVDPGRDVLSGWAAGLTLGRIGGGEWRWEVGARAASPGFDIRDAGSQRRADRIEARAAVSRWVRDSMGTLRNRGYGIAWTEAWNFGRVRQQASPSAFFSGTWANLWITYLEVGANLRSHSDDLTRGGPLMQTPRSSWVSLNLSGPRTGSAWWSLRGDGFLDEFRGWNTGFSGSLTVQRGRRLELSFLAGGSMGDDSRLFLAALGGGPPETYGIRYVFSAVERREVFLQGRVRLAFAPDAILTLYAEPFVSSGGIHHLGELPWAGARALRIYGQDGTSVIARGTDGAWQVTDGDDTFRVENHDFWIRSLRTTAVFRWEWWRGSSIFLIWQKSGWRFEDQVLGTDAGTFFGSLGDPGQDIFAAKVSLLFRPG